MIHLSKDGIRYKNGYKEGHEKHIDTMVDSLIPFLREEVELSEDYTLEDLFKILETEVDKYDIIFTSDLGHHPLQLYIDNINEEAPPVDSDDIIEFLEVQWVCNCEDYPAKGYSCPKAIEFYTDFHGWGVWDDGSPGGFAIEYSPLSELKHYPLKLKRKTKIRWDNGEYEKDSDGNMDNPILFEGDKYFSVYDFVSAILYEISWGGSPEQRDESLQNILNQKEEVDEKIESGDTSSFKNFNELVKDLKKE